jgi:toxin-antitoxin system PIN domain toxin
MRCVDVNVLVNAHRIDVAEHDRYAAWLDERRAGSEPLGLTGVVLSGFLRVVTHPRVFREPTTVDVALQFVERLRASSAATLVEPGARHWGIFTRLCERVAATGNVVPDAYLAAIAIEVGARWVTADRGFARFPELVWEHPLDAS